MQGTRASAARLPCHSGAELPTKTYEVHNEWLNRSNKQFLNSEKYCQSLAVLLPMSSFFILLESGLLLSDERGGHRSEVE